MKKLLVLGVLIVVVAVVSENTIAIEYNTAITPEVTVEVGECFYMDMQLQNTPTLWDFGFTYKVPDVAGPGTYVLACGNFACVSPDDVRIARAEICPITEGINTITITTDNNNLTPFSSLLESTPRSLE
jgi:hypothetical protein